MFQAKKIWLSFAALSAIVGGILLSQADVARAEKGPNGFLCVMDVVVETRNQTGLLVATETYQQEFTLQDGDVFFDDFSTRLRFKYFTAAHQKVDGEDTVSINWFADTTVFNSVDFNTSVTLADGQKRGKATGDHTFYSSNGSTTTRYSLTCLEN